jgi:flagellar motor switch protein FliN
MSLISATANADEALRFLEQEIGASWQAALEVTFGSDGFTLTASDWADSRNDQVWFSCDLLPAQFGCLKFGMDRGIAVELGHLLLSAKGRPSEHAHHALHATSHVIRQVAASLARSLSALLETAVTSSDCTPEVEAPDSQPHVPVPFRDRQGSTYLLTVCPSPDLVSALAAQLSCEPSTAVVPNSRATARNLDLLLDLEMPVSISFGSTRLALKDVAKLTTGSIVELNRALSEPVDIIVNNCAIARGEVVVADGNFAVRVKHVMSKQDRLRTLS